MNRLNVDFQKNCTLNNIYGNKGEFLFEKLKFGSL